MEIMTFSNGMVYLNEGICKQITEFEKSIKEMEKKRDQLKKAILEGMEQNNVKSISDETTGLKITYVASTDAETFDKKKFKADYPDLYDEYISMKPKAAYITVKVTE